MPPADSSGLLSIIAAAISAGGFVYTAVSKQQSDRENAAAAAQAEREKEQRKQLEDRIKALEVKNHDQDLALTTVKGDLHHLKEAVDDMRGLLRQVLGLPALRPSTPSLPGAE